jgi:hypothetical protein
MSDAGDLIAEARAWPSDMGEGATMNALADALEAALMRAENAGADMRWGPIPRYAMLDIWMAVYGSDRSQNFEMFADANGYAETWAWLCSAIRATTHAGTP